MTAFLFKAVSTQYLLNGFLCSHGVGCFELVLSLICFSFEGVGRFLRPDPIVTKHSFVSINGIP